MTTAGASHQTGGGPTRQLSRRARMPCRRNVAFRRRLPFMATAVSMYPMCRETYGQVTTT